MTFKNHWRWNETRTKRKAYNEAIVLEKEKKPLTDKQQEAKEAWLNIEKNQKVDTAQSNENERKMQGDYATVFTYWIPMNAGNEAWGTYHWAIWDCLGMMLVGMALFGWGFFSNRLSTSTYTMWLLVGYGFGIPHWNTDIQGRYHGTT
jgi:uncharacterized protein